MKLSISNIAWVSEYDEQMYAYLQKHRYDGIEIAPTRIFPQNPYENINQARIFASQLFEAYGLTVSSLQSIWYGKSEKIFGAYNERQDLLKYTKQAIDFAAALKCKNLVFGCPQNRGVPEGCVEYMAIAKEFFSEIAKYAEQCDTCVALEANPVIYGTNFLNRTIEVFELCSLVNKPGLKVNIDLGTIIYNNEDLSIIGDNIKLVNHIHISEPNLFPIQQRKIHAQLRYLDYNHYVSIEMKTQKDINIVKGVVEYIGQLLK